MTRQMQAGNEAIAIPFFLFLIAFGSYFILNLNLAVILAHFTMYEKKEEEMRQRKLKNEKLLEHNKDALESDDSDERKKISKNWMLALNKT